MAKKNTSNKTKKEISDIVRISVRVTPRSSRNMITGYTDNVLYLKLTAPPVEGAANETCCHFIAELLDIPKSHVAIASGEKNRNKIVSIQGLSLDEVTMKISQAVAQP